MFQWVIGIAVLLAFPALALDVSIEDRDLGAINSGVAAAVATDPDWGVLKECTLIGKQIDLHDEGGGSNYFVTTFDACGCGAAICPMWIVRTVNGMSSRILSDGGEALTIKDARHKGLADVETDSATAANERKMHFEFDGTAYAQKRPN